MKKKFLILVVGLFIVTGCQKKEISNINSTEINIQNEVKNEFIFNSSLCIELNAMIPPDATADDIKKLLTE